MIPRTRALLLVPSQLFPAIPRPRAPRSPPSTHLFRGAAIDYTSGMGEGTWIVAAVILGVVVYLIGRQVYRRWLAGRLADNLLREVVKGKDAFRR